MYFAGAFEYALTLNVNPKPRTMNRYASKRFIKILYQMKMGFYRMKLETYLKQMHFLTLLK